MCGLWVVRHRVARRLIQYARPHTEMSRLPVILGGICALVYAVLAAILAWSWFIRANFGAVFFLGLLGLPSSYLGPLLVGGENLHLQVVLMICLGLVQYFAAGWLIGRVLLALLPRRTN